MDNIDLIRRVRAAEELAAAIMGIRPGDLKIEIDLKRPRASKAVGKGYINLGIKHLFVANVMDIVGVKSGPSKVG